MRFLYIGKFGADALESAKQVKESEVKMKIDPLREEKCPAYRSEEGFARDLLLRQCARRPEVWGVGLWPDVESENVAKVIAHLFEEDDKNLRAAFVPNDPIKVLVDHNLAFGGFEFLPTVFRLFDCKIEEEEFSAQPNMTLGEFVALIVARKRKTPDTPAMRAFGDKSVGRDPVELVCLMCVLSILCSWIVKYVFYTYAYLHASVVITLVWCVFVGGCLLRRGWRRAWSNIGQYFWPMVVFVFLYNALTAKLFLMLGGG